MAPIDLEFILSPGCPGLAISRRRPGGPATPRTSDRTPGARREDVSMDYDVVIANGIVVGAEGEARADVAIRGETIAAVGPGLAAAGRRRRRDHRRDGPLRDPGRGRRARPSRAPLLRHGLERRLEHRHPRGGPRRRDDRDRLRHPLRRGEPASTPSTTGWPGPSPRRASITASTWPSPTGTATGPRWRSWSAWAARPSRSS